MPSQRKIRVIAERKEKKKRLKTINSAHNKKLAQQKRQNANFKKQIHEFLGFSNFKLKKVEE
jgi:hypothetical protein